MFQTVETRFCIAMSWLLFFIYENNWLLNYFDKRTFILFCKQHARASFRPLS